MAMILRRDQIKSNQIFPVEILRSLIPLLIAGLTSTQMRLRQSTYRFIMAGAVLGGMRWLLEKDGVELIKAVEYARETFEEDTLDGYGRRVVQVLDYGTFVLSHVVESGVRHPTTLKPIILTGPGDIKWSWYGPDGKDFPLGHEEVFTDEERERVDVNLEARVASN